VLLLQFAWMKSLKSKANKTRLRKAIADLNAGKGKVHELAEVAGA